MKILITTNNTKESLALAFLLKHQDLVFGTDFENFPNAESESLAHQILAFSLDHQITTIYPIRINEVASLLKSAVLFAEYGIDIKYNNFNHQNNIETANSFPEFSTKALSLGYPKQKIAIGLQNQTGKILVIDDEVRDFNSLWFEVNSFSFIQIGKLFNGAYFQSLSLFKVEEFIEVNYLLVCDGELRFIKQQKQMELMVTSEVLNRLKDGFYTIYHSGNYLLRLSNF